MAYFAFGSIRTACALSNWVARLNQLSASPFRISFNWGSVVLSDNCVHRNAFSRHSIGSLGMTRGSAVTSQRSNKLRPHTVSNHGQRS